MICWKLKILRFSGGLSAKKNPRSKGGEFSLVALTGIEPVTLGL